MITIDEIHDSGDRDNYNQSDSDTDEGKKSYIDTIMIHILYCVHMLHVY